MKIAEIVITITMIVKINMYTMKMKIIVMKMAEMKIMIAIFKVCFVMMLM